MQHFQIVKILINTGAFLIKKITKNKQVKIVYMTDTNTELRRQNKTITKYLDRSHKITFV